VPTHPAHGSDNFYPPWEPWMTQFNPQGYGVDVEKGVAIYHRWGNRADGRLERLVIVLNGSPDASSATAAGCTVR